MYYGWGGAYFIILLDAGVPYCGTLYMIIKSAFDSWLKGKRLKIEG
jgi:hypothetical protein